MPLAALSSSHGHSSSIELANAIYLEAQSARVHLEFATDRAIESEATVLLIKSARSHERLLTSAILLETRVHEARSYLSGFAKHASH